LATAHVMGVFASAILLAIVASIIAAYQATKMDPAEAMRDE